MGLRTDRGIRTADLTQEARILVAEWVADEIAEISSGGVRLTPRGWLLLDLLVVDLDLALAKAAMKASSEEECQG